MAVDDRLHGHGLGTILLERLALLAIRHGFTKLWAITHADNLAMREVFATSGFTMEEHLEGGDMEVELSLAPTDQSVRQSEWRERVATTASLRPVPSSHRRRGRRLRSPRVSATACLMRCAANNGFRGHCYAVNPHASKIADVEAFPSLRAPEPADLVVIAVAERSRSFRGRRLRHDRSPRVGGHHRRIRRSRRGRTSPAKHSCWRRYGSMVCGWSAQTASAS